MITKPLEAIPVKLNVAAALHGRIVKSRKKQAEMEAAGLKKTEAYKAEVKRMNGLIAERERLSREVIEDNARLRETLLVLLALSQTLSTTGYEFAKQVEQIYGGVTDAQYGFAQSIIRACVVLDEAVEAIDELNNKSLSWNFANMADEIDDGLRARLLEWAREVAKRHGSGTRRLSGKAK